MMAFLYQPGSDRRNQSAPNAPALVRLKQVDGLQLSRIYGIATALWPTDCKADYIPVVLFSNIRKPSTVGIR